MDPSSCLDRIHHIPQPSSQTQQVTITNNTWVRDINPRLNSSSGIHVTILYHARYLFPDTSIEWLHQFPIQQNYESISHLIFINFFYFLRPLYTPEWVLFNTEHMVDFLYKSTTICQSRNFMFNPAMIFLEKRPIYIYIFFVLYLDPKKWGGCQYAVHTLWTIAVICSYRTVVIGPLYPVSNDVVLNNVHMYTVTMFNGLYPRLHF